jgi:hypothetical protein
MRNFKLVLLFTCSLSSALFAEIPEIIKTYLDKNKTRIEKWTKTQEATSQEQSAVSVIIADALIRRYKAALDPRQEINDAKKELAAYIHRMYLSRDQTIHENTHGSLSAINELIAHFNGSINYKLAEGLARINYHGHTLPLQINTKDDGTVLIKLKGINMPLDNLAPRSSSFYDDCLELVVNLQEKTANLEWIGSVETICPIPDVDQKGNYLVKLAEDLAKNLGAQTMHLEDLSRISCAKNQSTTPFRLLRIFLDKPSWYQTHNYEPVDGKTASSLMAEYHSIRALKLSEMMDELKSLAGENRAKIDEIITSVEDFKSNNNGNLAADFLAWLWEKNCEQYQNVIEIIMTDTNLLRQFKLFVPFKKSLI